MTQPASQNSNIQMTGGSANSIHLPLDIAAAALLLLLLLLLVFQVLVPPYKKTVGVARDDSFSVFVPP